MFYQIEFHRVNRSNLNSNLKKILIKENQDINIQFVAKN